MPIVVSERVQKRRASLRAAGLRPVQIWVPDTRNPGVSQECRRQSHCAAEADLVDEDLLNLLDESLSRTRGWAV
jgi:hypothetical protein